MATTFESPEVDLPVIPAPRAAQCPLHPPAQFADWRAEPGLRRVMYQGRPAWAVSRYQDIRTALVDRNTRGHLGFGYGVHQCIGQNLARVEMQVAFATLARRLPGLSLAVSPDQLQFKYESGISGMKQLPVSW